MNIMNDLAHVNFLLGQIQIISKKIREQRHDKRAKGEFYNIFRDLEMMSDEVRLHSSFIASLLNPKGSHGQKDKYLKAFMGMLHKAEPTKVPLDFLLTSSPGISVQVEKNIGELTSLEGGRLDIYVTDTKHRVIIENKIYAGDQKNQMRRYWNYGIKKGAGTGQASTTFRLVYLTLDGHKPDDSSTNGLTDDNYICISYKSEILSWLERCLELSARQPLIRETIIQYINTIKSITNITMEKNDELLEILGKEDNLNAVFDIANNCDNLVNNIVNKEFLPALSKIAEEKGFELEYEEGDWINRSWAGGDFHHKDWKFLKGRFEFEKRGLNDLIFGYRIKNDYKRSDVLDWEKVQERYGAKDRNNQFWIWKVFKGDRWWKNATVTHHLKNGTTLNQFSEMLDELLECAKGLNI